MGWTIMRINKFLKKFAPQIAAKEFEPEPILENLLATWYGQMSDKAQARYNAIRYVEALEEGLKKEFANSIRNVIDELESSNDFGDNQIDFVVTVLNEEFQ